VKQDPDLFGEYPDAEAQKLKEMMDDDGGGEDNNDCFKQIAWKLAEFKQAKHLCVLARFGPGPCTFLSIIWALAS
jgi:hypothetical protein